MKKSLWIIGLLLAGTLASVGQPTPTLAQELAPTTESSIEEDYAVARVVEVLE